MDESVQNQSSSGPTEKEPVQPVVNNAVQSAERNESKQEEASAAPDQTGNVDDGGQTVKREAPVIAEVTVDINADRNTHDIVETVEVTATETVAANVSEAVAEKVASTIAEARSTEGKVVSASGAGEPAKDTLPQTQERNAPTTESTQVADAQPEVTETAPIGSTDVGRDDAMVVDESIKREESPEIKLESHTNGTAITNGTGSKRKRSSSPKPLIQKVPPQLAYGGLKTGICYDVRMRYHSKMVTSNDDYIDPHPEDPRRTYRIYKAIAEAGLIDDLMLYGTDALGDYAQKIQISEAKPEEILLVHSQEHLDFISSTVDLDQKALLNITESGDSIYVNNDTFECAKLSCGGAIAACRAVVEGTVKNAVAIIRPPGHHAEPLSPGGFCMFSNVAVAAKVMLQQYPESVRRIIVVDWDVHHGNGTQKAFYDDPRVLYISLHRYDNGKFYPGTVQGNLDKCGEGAGEGFNLNIPWPHGGMNDADYLYAFRQAIMPVATEFDPDLVIISSGFDAAVGDPLGACKVSPNGYAQMTHELMSLARGQLVVCLEGGYNLDSIAVSALAVTKTLMGDPPGRPDVRVPSVAAVKTVDRVVRAQARYWKCLRFGYAAAIAAGAALHSTDILRADDGTSLETEHLTHIRAQTVSQVLLENNATHLNKHFGMTVLPVIPPIKSYIEPPPILATPDIHRAQTIVVIIRDPPEVTGSKDPYFGTLDVSESLTLDGAYAYQKWAMEKGYGIVDMCISNEQSDIVAQDSCVYLWDNYIEFFDATSLIFIGIGDAYCGLVHLIGHRDIRSRTNATISFLGRVPMRPVIPVIDEYIVDWFYRSSLVFTSADHSAFEESKKPRRKFGHVIRAKSSGLTESMSEKYDQAIAHVEASLE